MKKLTIIRFADTPFGTFGRLQIPDGPIIYTLEDRWRNNAVGESCIPAGTYVCKARPYYGGGYDAIEVKNVENRSHILIHIGNTHVDTKGCILVGSKLGCVKGLWAVLSSGNTFRDILMKWFIEQNNSEDFSLEIIWDCVETKT